MTLTNHLSRDTPLKTFEREDGPSGRGLVVRTYNILMREGYQTVGAVLDLDLERAKGFRNMSNKTLEDIQELQQWFLVGLSNESDELLALYGDALHAGNCRIEFGFAFPLDGSGTRKTVTLYTKTDKGRWVAVKPHLVADPGEGRDALLDQLARTYRITAPKESA